MKNPPGKERALDCGAGIGRITKHLLTNFFRKVDLVEPVKPFIDEARNYIQNDDKIGDLYNVGKFKMKWISSLVEVLSTVFLINYLFICVLEIFLYY